MTSGLKFAVLFLSLSLASCGSKEQATAEIDTTVSGGPIVQNPGPASAPEMRFPYPPEMLDEIVSKPKSHRPVSSEEAAKLYLSLPKSGEHPSPAILPHILPAREIQKVRETRDTAVYGFVSNQGNERGEIELAKFRKGSDSVWIVSAFKLEREGMDGDPNVPPHLRSHPTGQ